MAIVEGKRAGELRRAELPTEYNMSYIGDAHAMLPVGLEHPTFFDGGGVPRFDPSAPDGGILTSLDLGMPEYAWPKELSREEGFKLVDSVMQMDGLGAEELDRLKAYGEQLLPTRNIFQQAWDGLATLLVGNSARRGMSVEEHELYLNLDARVRVMKEIEPHALARKVPVDVEKVLGFDLPAGHRESLEKLTTAMSPSVRQDLLRWVQAINMLDMDPGNEDASKLAVESFGDLINNLPKSKEFSGAEKSVLMETVDSLQTTFDEKYQGLRNTQFIVDTDARLLKMMGEKNYKMRGRLYAIEQHSLMFFDDVGSIENQAYREGVLRNRMAAMKKAEERGWDVGQLGFRWNGRDAELGIATADYFSINNENMSFPTERAASSEEEFVVTHHAALLNHERFELFEAQLDLSELGPMSYVYHKAIAQALQGDSRYVDYLFHMRPEKLELIKAKIKAFHEELDNKAEAARARIFAS